MVIASASTAAAPQRDNDEAAEAAARVASGPGFWTEWLAELGRQGLLEDLLAGDVIARALREASTGHKYDRVLTAKMTVVCVLVGCLFPGAGYDSVLATAFGLPGLILRPGAGTPTGPALSQARRLLGEQVMKTIFESTRPSPTRTSGSAAVERPGGDRDRRHHDGAGQERRALLVIGAEILGATTLQQYGLALTVGLLSGAYSSIFIASPVLAMLKEHEPRYTAIRQRLESRGERVGLLTPAAAALAVAGGARCTPGSPGATGSARRRRCARVASRKPQPVAATASKGASFTRRHLGPTVAGRGVWCLRARAATARRPGRARAAGKASPRGVADARGAAAVGHGRSGSVERW